MNDLRRALRRVSRIRMRSVSLKDDDPEEEELSQIFKLVEEGDVTRLLAYQLRWNKSHPKHVEEPEAESAPGSGENDGSPDADTPENEVKSLLHMGRRVKKTTPLMIAAELGREEIIRHVFLTGDEEEQLSINAKDINGHSALTYACKKANATIAKLLLEHGADPYIQRNQTESSWYWAVKHGNIEIVNELLDSGLVDVNMKIFDNRSSAIIEASKHGRLDIFTLLFENDKVNIYERDSLGKNSIDYCYYFKRENIQSFVEQNHAQSSRNIYRSRANVILGVNAAAHITVESLASAAKNGDLRTLTSILGEGAEVNQRSLNGTDTNREDLQQLNLAKGQALLEAVNQNDIEIVRYLTSVKRTILSDQNLMQAVTVAATYGYVETLRLLLLHFGGDSDTVNVNVTPAIEIAFMTSAKEGQESTFRMILHEVSDKINATIREDCLKRCCELGNFRIVNALLEHIEGFGEWSRSAKDDFVVAVQKGNFLTMKALIQNGFNADQFIEISKKRRTDESITLWEHALTQPTSHMLRSLLECHDHVNINTTISQTLGSPLLAAVKLRNRSAVSLILDKNMPWFSKVNPNIVDKDLMTALHVAVVADYNGRNADLVRMILQHPDVDVNTFSNKYTSPIQDAKYLETAAVLMEDGRVDFMMKNMYGMTALIHMCCEGRWEQVEKLLTIDNREEMVNERDGYGETAFMRCASMDRAYVYNSSMILNWCRCAKALLACENLNLGLHDDSGKTAFIHSCNVARHRSGVLPEDGDILDLLLRHQDESQVDVGVNSEDSMGNTGLVYACMQENSRSVEVLLQRLSPQQVGKINYERASAFDLAVSTGNTNLVRRLIKHGKGIDINGKSHRGYTPLNRACEAESVEIVDMILKHPTFRTINSKLEPRGKAAIHIAIRDARYYPIVERLLKHPGINVNIKEDQSGFTPLMMACQRSQSSEKIVDALLAHPNIDVNAQCPDGDTALMVAVRDQRVYQIMKLLTHPNVDVNLKNNKGETALHIAASHGSIEIPRLLVSLGKKLQVNEMDNEGKTPEDIARDICSSGFDGNDLLTFLNKQGVLSGKRVCNLAETRDREKPMITTPQEEHSNNEELTED